jgi:uncharacterized membrane protein YfcA
VTWQFVLTGFLIGTLVGLTGMGGGGRVGLLALLVYGLVRRRQAHGGRNHDSDDVPS